MRYSLMYIGPATDGGEFLDTLVHEVRHLANDIADHLGVPLDAEIPSYISGDTVRDLADIVCEFGCKRCA